MCQWGRLKRERNKERSAAAEDGQRILGQGRKDFRLLGDLEVGYDSGGCA